MNTPISRRRFLTAALAVPATALALSKVAAKPPTSEPPNVALTSSPLPLEWRVKGLAIRVPSNRALVEDRDAIQRHGYHDWCRHHRYIGDWDGTFKLEAGCSNPAYILADLTERVGIDYDWVTHTRWSASFVGDNGWRKQPLNWQMLYDWGRACDELVWDVKPGPLFGGAEVSNAHPRFEVNTFVSTPEELTTLRETLRMHCLRWQASDPRYRTSWPGVGYPEEGRV